MIAVKLMGGLGNQMFQYAAGRRLAAVNKTSLVLDASHYHNQPPEEVPRHYELGCFRFNAKVYDQPLEETGLKQLFKSVQFRTVREKDLAFDASILDLPDNSLLIGYWQSEKYFKDYTALINNDFKFKDKLSARKQVVADKIMTTESVSVQVRRGDFVSHKHSSQFHGTLPMAYYRKATEELVKKIHEPHFFVISDDPDWCRQHIKFGKHPITYVDHIPGTGEEDMRLTSLCQHNIIANSTFSWWGAWLNTNSSKIVMTPKKWFVDKKINTKDLVPTEWQRI